MFKYIKLASFIHAPCDAGGQGRKENMIGERKGVLALFYNFFRFLVMRRSIRKFNIPPRATPRAFELLKIGLFKFPPLGAK